MDNLEYIDDYYQHERSPEKTRLFEEKILHDPGFAEDLAFYLSARDVAKESYAAEGTERFREIYQKGKLVNMVPERRFSIRVRYFAAAAMVAAVLLGIFIWYKPTSPQQLADRYIQENLLNLPVTMGSMDSMQVALDLYNKTKLQESLKYFQAIARANNTNYSAKTYAGIIFIRLQQYDSAINYFNQVQADTTLYAHPALFYEALALMKRNQAGDTEMAKKLLTRVKNDNLEGKETAEEWLRKL